MCVTEGLAFYLGHSPCPHTHTLYPPAMQPYAAPVCGVMFLTYLFAWITTHLPISRGMEGWVGLVCWPTVDSYSKSSHLSTVDWVQVRESLPARDRCPNDWATMLTDMWMLWLFRWNGDSDEPENRGAGERRARCVGKGALRQTVQLDCSPNQHCTQLQEVCCNNSYVADMSHTLLVWIAFCSLYVLFIVLIHWY